MCGNYYLLQKNSLVMAFYLLPLALFSQVGPSDIFANLQLERIATGFQFTEGPAWHPEGFLVFSDIQGNTVYKWSEENGVEVLLNPSGNSNGIFTKRNDELVLARQSTRDIAHVDKNGNVSSLISQFEGKKLNSPNDITESFRGSLYFTDPPYGVRPEDEELGFYGVYCLPFDGTGLQLIDDQLTKPNGIVFSPDGRQLYVCDSYSNQIFVYSLKDEWVVRDKSVFAQLSGEGTLDGITTDVYGNVYVAFSDGGVEIFYPDGTKAGHIDLPERVRNLCFGGKYKNMLYITAGQSVYRVEIRFKGDFIAPGLLGIPSDRSIVFNALSDYKMDAYIEYGILPGSYPMQTPVRSFAADLPIEIPIENLEANTRYFYRLRYKTAEGLPFANGREGTFQTQRSEGVPFSFAIEADPHLDESSNYFTFRKMLENALSAQPDFLIDLGDNFMNDRLPLINAYHIEQRNLLYRHFWDEVCHSMPLYITIGNHEGEFGWELDNTADNLPNMANYFRKLYYPNPCPNDFYTGSTEENPFTGKRENYYAWHWGDALFVIIDPYLYTENKRGNSGDNWNFTLGKTQYDWFRETLENSRAKFKFVFAHQLIGGVDEGRGGAEASVYFEMGGKNLDGSYGFDEQRPGWGKPIHELMVDQGVQIYFHGHDHFYAKQERDGVIYQLVPQPSHTNYNNVNNAEPYSYLGGEILPNSGHLLVTVNGEEARVDYVSAYHQDNPGKDQISGSIRHSYTVRSNSVSPVFDYQLKADEPLRIRQDHNGDVWVLATQVIQGEIDFYTINGHEIFSSHTNLWPKQEQKVVLPENLPGGIYLLTIKTTSFITSKIIVR